MSVQTKNIATRYSAPLLRRVKQHYSTAKECASCRRLLSYRKQFPIRQKIACRFTRTNKLYFAISHTSAETFQCIPIDVNSFDYNWKHFLHILIHHIQNFLGISWVGVHQIFDFLLGIANNHILVVVHSFTQGLSAND